MEPDITTPEDPLAGSAVPADPYTALKQNYDGIVVFITTVSVHCTQHTLQAFRLANLAGILHNVVC